MADNETNSNQQPDVMDQVNNSFPSDEELQNTKKKRNDFIQNNIVQKLREAGFPELGENLGAAAMTVSDSVTPDTRKDYMQGLAMPAVGSIENRAAGAMKPAFHEAVQAGESGAGSNNFAKFIRGGENAPPMGPSGGTASSLENVRIGREQIPGGQSVSGEATYYKPGAGLEKGEIQGLQQEYQDAASLGTREGDQKAKGLLQKIREKRGPRMGS